MMKFLVVDDDPAILKFVKGLLELEQHHVYVCDHALAAITHLKENPVDILISDATMPSYSGFDLIRTLRKDPKLKNLTVAMLTGRNQKEDIEQALSLGVKDYIVKPLEPKVFLEKIHRLIRKNRESTPSPYLSCELRHSIRLLAITPQGVLIESPHTMGHGQVVHMDLPPLKEAGLLKNKFKVTQSQHTPGELPTIQLELLQLTQKEQQVLSTLAKQWFVNTASA